MDVAAGKDFVPVEAAFTKAGFGKSAVTPVKGVDVWRPNPAELTLEVPPADEQSVLTVAQNYSEGWEAYDSSGHKLVPIRIGGWQQGWLLPAGPEQVVTARFMPDRSYRAGLLVGLLGLLSVATLAVFSRRRSRHSGHRLREASRIAPWLATAWPLPRAPLWRAGSGWPRQRSPSCSPGSWTAGSERPEDRGDRGSRRRSTGRDAGGA